MNKLSFKERTFNNGEERYLRRYLNKDDENLGQQELNILNLYSLIFFEIWHFVKKKIQKSLPYYQMKIYFLKTWKFDN